MMKRLTMLLLFSFAFFSLFAQTAESVLDKASAKMRDAKGINVSFLLTQKDNQERVISNSKGSMKIKGDKYYINQNGNETYCNGVQVWNYDGQHEVIVAKVDNDDDGFSPKQILTGFNKKDFTIQLISSTGTNYQIQLVPLDKRQNFKQITLYINKATNLVSKAAVTDKTGSQIEINFVNISLNASFADNQFVFDAAKHPGVEVINN